jgi:hypothetical protein
MKTKKTPKQIRQGDVLLIARPAPVKAAPAVDANGQPLAGLLVPGERTGHAHRLPAAVYEAGDGARLLYLDQLGTLTHDEHAAVTVPAGWWEVRLQRQYVGSPRPVLRARFD